MTLQSFDELFSEALSEKELIQFFEKRREFVSKQELSSALFVAAQANKTELAIYLIDHGADVNAVREDQLLRTPLQWAVVNHNYELARKLLRNDANIWVADGNGDNAKVLSQKSKRSPEDLEIVKLLERYQHTLSCKAFENLYRDFLAKGPHNRPISDEV